MRKHTFTSIFIILATSASVFGQFNFQLWTSNSRTGIPGETLIILGDLENLSGADMEIQITRIEENVPDDWNTAMCTDVCQVPSISQVNYTLVWGEYQTYSMYFYTAPGNEGAGNVTVKMTNLADTTNTFTQQYFGATEFAVSTSEVQNLGKQARVYPTLLDNTGWLEIPEAIFAKTENLVLQIVNASGQLVHSMSILQPLTQFNRNQLPAGTYFFALRSKDGLLKAGKLIFQ